MKKILSLVIILFIAFTLVGCNNGENVYPPIDETTLEYAVSLFPERVNALVPKHLDEDAIVATKTRSIMFLSNDIVFPPDRGYTYPTSPLSYNRQEESLNGSGIWSIINKNVTDLIGEDGWVLIITRMLSGLVEGTTVIPEDGVFTVYNDGFEGRVEYIDGHLDIIFFHAFPNDEYPGEYDRVYAHYNDEDGFIFIATQYDGNGDDFVATYMNKQLNLETDNAFTMLSMNGSKAGIDDVLITISKDEYSVTSSLDGTREFERANIIVTKNSGSDVGQLRAYDSSLPGISGWEMIFSLNAFDNWTNVEFDGTGPGVIYNDDIIIPRYGILLNNQVPYITQDLSTIITDEFTTEIVDTIFTYPDGLVLTDYQTIKDLILTVSSNVDASSIGLLEFSTNAVLDVIAGIESNFPTMNDVIIRKH